MSNTSSSVTKAVTDAYLAITQDISQSLETQQIVILKCDSISKKIQCQNCTKWWNDNMSLFNPPPDSDYVNKMCAPVCNCTANKVDMSQTIVVNFESFLKNSNQQEFINQISNSLSQKASEDNSGIVSSNTKNYTNYFNSLYSGMQSTTFQAAVQGLTAMQIVAIEGTGKLAVVNLSQAIDYISNVLETNEATSSIMTDLQTHIIQDSTQITKAGLEQIIEWIVQIVLFVVILLVLFYSIGLMFEVFTLAL
jgi:hypothetical protein